MVKNLLTLIWYPIVKPDAYLAIELTFERNERLTMKKMILSGVRKFGCVALAGLTIALTPVTASADAGFKQWINQFYATAAKEGISRATYQKAFAGVTEPDPDALRKATFQPEFTTQIWDYLDSRVNPYTVRIGREMKMKHATTLNWIERNFGVDKHVILAIWSMESNTARCWKSPNACTIFPRRWRHSPIPTRSAQSLPAPS